LADGKAMIKGPPGVIALIRGMERLNNIIEGFNLAKDVYTPQPPRQARIVPIKIATNVAKTDFHRFKPTVVKRRA
jgi:hypothetical protein